MKHNKSINFRDDVVLLQSKLLIKPIFHALKTSRHFEAGIGEFPVNM